VWNGSAWVPRIRVAQYDFQRNAVILGRYDDAGTTYTDAVCLRHDALGRLTLAARIALNALGSAYYCEIDTYLSTIHGKFKYDARNRRVARFEPSTGRWTYVVSDAAGNPLSEIALVSGAWVPVRDHVWLDGRPLAQIEYPSGGGADRYYHHVDHLGLPRALTNAAGQVVWSATPARPYGDVTETVPRTRSPAGRW
jgi:uncharacterized protein RhaS with RHS repeats